MSLPSQSDINAMDFVLDGQPFVQTGSNIVSGLGTMDYVSDAQPFVSDDFAVSVLVSSTSTATTSLSTIKSIAKTLQYVANTSFVDDRVPSIKDYTVTTSLSSIKSIGKTIDFVASTAVAMLTGNNIFFTAVTTMSTIKQISITKDFTASTSLSAAKALSLTKSYTGTTVPVLSSVPNVIIHYDNSFTTRLGVLQSDDHSFTAKLGVLANQDNSFSTQMSVMEYDLVAVTNVCSVSNVFQPAIIINGQYVTPFTSALTPDPSQYCLFVNMQNAGVTGIDICKLHNFGFTLDNNGGNWFITVPENIYNCFDEVTIFGFNGVVTAKSIELTGSGAGFNFSGNFSTNELNENMEYLFLDNIVFNKLLSNQNLIPNQIALWATAKSAAQQITNKAHATLQWLIPDQPLPGFKPQEGTTGLSALASIAQQAGGVLRWNGSTKFKVVYQDFFEGVWKIPSCDLIQGSVKCETFCDLARGRSYSKSSAANLPGLVRSNLASVNAQIKTVPGGAQPQVQLLTKLTKRLTADDPPLIFDLPFNYDEVWIQTLVPANGATGGTNLVDPVHNYVTRNPQQYFSFDVVGLASDYIFVTNIGGVQQPQVKLDYKILPQDGTNSSVDNGNFVTSVYYTTKAIANPVADTVSDRANLTGQLKYAFYRTNTCTFSTVFFGSIPLPGMKVDGLIPDVKLYIPDCNNPGAYLTQNLGDIVLNGIIDSVNFTYPGTVTVTCSNWRRLIIYNTSDSNGRIPGVI